MSLISWNCHGLDRPLAVRALLDPCQSHRPQILGLIETKLRARDWELLRVKLGYQNYKMSNY